MTMKRTTVDGHVVNVRTLQMLNRAQNRLGMNLSVVQGSYNAGGVSASAGTHDGGGALDLSVRGYSNDTINKVVLAMREVGFAAWHRVPSQGPWTEHIHCIAIGDEEMSSGAATQVREYKEGQNGLASHLKDDGPRLDVIPEWPVKLAPVSLSKLQNQFDAKTPRKVLAVQRLQHLLNYRLGAGLAEDGIAGNKTKQSYKSWETHIGVDSPDFKPGKTQLQKLFAGWYTLSK